VAIYILLVMKVKLICPDCGSFEVKKIAYGFPDFDNFDFDRFEVGGCCVTAGIRYINVLSVRVVGRFIKRLIRSRKYPSQVSSW